MNEDLNYYYSKKEERLNIITHAFGLLLSVIALPFLIVLIVQEVLVFAVVQDFPPAVTLLPVIFEPPLDVGKAIVTFTLTLPFFTAEEDMAEMVGAEGFVTFA